MKHIKLLAGILTACLLLTVVSCSPSDAPADTQTETETVAATAPQIEFDTTTPIRYIYTYGSDWKTEKARYEELCIGAAEEHSDPSIGSFYSTSMYLSAPLIYAKVHQAIHIPFMVMSEDVGFHEANFDVTWRIAEPDRLAILKVDEKRFMGGCRGLYLPESGFEVCSLSTGVAHLYITVTNPENGMYMTMQQIIVIEE